MQTKIQQYRSRPFLNRFHSWRLCDKKNEGAGADYKKDCQGEKQNPSGLAGGGVKIGKLMKQKSHETKQKKKEAQNQLWQEGG